MKKHLFISATLVLALFACGSEKKEQNNNEEPAKDTAEVAETKHNVPPAVLPDSATMMKNWMEYMTPGDMHKMIARYDGTFDGEVTMWMASNAPPSTSKSVAINKMIFGGRYQQSEHKGSFGGMPFEGQSMLAYDNSKKKFISTWIDNMGSGIMIMEGFWDEPNKAIQFTGSMVDPMTGIECEMRETFTFIDDNNQLIESWCKPKGGKEYKNMEIKYTRKK